ncbi:MAG TPA: hypothetical protein PK347_00375 [Burkholderiaceae bacterium]|nr:hypothetical protein [Burkholderiaceae bacterium]
MKRTAPPQGYAAAHADMKARMLAGLMHTAAMAGRLPSVPLQPEVLDMARAAHLRLQATLPARKHTLKG